MLKACIHLSEEKISLAIKGMEEAQASANAETKSSAGDKYETGRAMGQNERDLYARQLAELLHIQKIILSINGDNVCQEVKLGALVETTESDYFIAASLGVMVVEGKNIMTISAVSPIAQAMLGLKKGDSFEWMKKELTIESIS